MDTGKYAGQSCIIPVAGGPNHHDGTERDETSDRTCRSERNAMRIFLAGIIQGSLVEPTINSQLWREPIKNALARHLPEAEVYCHYAQHPNSITYDLPEIRSTLSDGIERAGNCDLLVAYVPSASMGTAIEMYEAYRGGAAVVAVTPLAANWIIRAYSHHVVADIAAFEAFAASGQLERLVRETNRK